MSTKGGGGAPPVDMTAAAEAMGRSSQRNIQQQTYANRPDVVTPWGTMSWEVQPAEGYQPPTYDQPPGGKVPGFGEMPGTPSGGDLGDVGAGAPGGGGPAAGGGGGGYYGPPDEGGGPGQYYDPNTGLPTEPSPPNFPPGAYQGPPGENGEPGQWYDPSTGLPIDPNQPPPAEGPPDESGGGGGGGDIPLERWRQTVRLNPQQQAIFESQQATQLGRSRLAEDVLGQGATELGRGVDWAGLAERGQNLQPGGAEGARQRAEEAIYGQATSRLDPRFRQEEEAITSHLYNQGLRPGTEAWNEAMGNFQRAKTDAYQQAMYGAFTGGGAEAQRQLGMETGAGQYQTQLRQAQLAEELQRRGSALNEVQALLSGQQVGMPGFPGFTSAGAAQATQYLPAAQAQQQAQLQQQQLQQQQQQALLSGLTGAASIPFMF